MSSDPPLLDRDIDLALLGSLLKRARREAGLKQKALGDAVGASERTLSRWETGALPPSRDQLEGLLELLGGASEDTLLEVRRVAGLQNAPAEAARPGTIPAPPPADPKAALDVALREHAEELDVSAGRLRAVIASMLAHVERLGLPLSTARGMIARGPKPRT
jgi:transcriptional regulator with XRE-family HTH domain